MLKNGVDVSRGLSMYFYNPFQDEVDVMETLSTEHKLIHQVNQLLNSGTVLRLKKAHSKAGKPSPQIHTTKQITFLTMQIFDSKVF